MLRRASKTGNIALSVLPVPVGAIRTRFFFCKIRGIACSCAGESRVNPRFLMHARTWLPSSSSAIAILLRFLIHIVVVKQHREMPDICPVGKNDLRAILLHAPRDR